MQNETVELQTNLMNNPIELLFKLSLRCMKVHKLEFEDSLVDLVTERSDLANDQ